MLLLQCLFLPHHDAGSCWPLHVPLPQHCPIQAQSFIQCRLCLVWADSCERVSNSIVLSLVSIFSFYFSALLLLHPICPACVDRRWEPLPSCFPSHPSPFWHAIVALPSPRLCRSGAMPSSPCSFLAGTIFKSAPPPPLQQYPYLLAITIDVRLLHLTHPLLPSLLMLMPTS